MPARKTTAHYRAIAERRELTWLGPIAGNTKALTGWRCCRGHEFLACYNNIDQRMRCKFCVREDLGQEQRHGPAEYHALAEKRGIFWLGPAVKSAVMAQTVWECPCEHRWSTRFNTIQQGRGCPRCGRERRVTRVRRQPAEYRSFAASRGFKWLGPVVQSGKARTEWECQEGHRWFSNYNRIDQGSGCRLLRGPRTADLLGFPRDRRRGEVSSGSELTPLIRGRRSRGDAASAMSGIRRTVRFWVAVDNPCSGNPRKAIEEFSRLAEQRGFLWHGPLVPNSKTKTEWECPRGHRCHFAPFNAIDQGNGCRRCSGPTAQDPRRLPAIGC